MNDQPAGGSLSSGGVRQGDPRNVLNSRSSTSHKGSVREKTNHFDSATGTGIDAISDTNTNDPKPAERKESSAHIGLKSNFMTPVGEES